MMQAFIGLEIHIQLNTTTKIFCTCKNHFGNEQNSNICLVCMGYPGTLPVLNERAVFQSYVVARALQSSLSDAVRMERKNYFYPDLPKNHQISQFAEPIGRNGKFILTDVGPIQSEGGQDAQAGKASENDKAVRIREVHLEEDAGKLIHVGTSTLCDYNRTGTPLLEIVTEPDLISGAEAELLMRQFQRLVRYLEVCDGNMESGSMRCDANISVGKAGKLPEYRVEIKNLNSPRFVRKALDYEIARQTKVLSEGGTITQHTRQWNENRDKTEELREKEDMHDYRYLPEPDIPPYHADAQFFERVNAAMIELPNDRKRRFITEFGINRDTADILSSDRRFADFFEALVSSGIDARMVANWMTVDIRQQLKHHNYEHIQDSTLSLARAKELLGLLQDGKIHGKLAKQILEKVFTEDKSPSQIVDEQGWNTVTDSEELLKLVREVLERNKEVVEQSTDNNRSISFLMGQIMKASKGSADPRLASNILRQQLEEAKKV